MFDNLVERVHRLTDRQLDDALHLEKLIQRALAESNLEVAQWLAKQRTF